MNGVLEQAEGNYSDLFSESTASIFVSGDWASKVDREVLCFKKAFNYSSEEPYAANRRLVINHMKCSSIKYWGVDV